MPAYLELDENKLRQLVEIEQLPHWKVADILSVSRDTIVRRCRELRLKTQRTGPRDGHFIRAGKVGDDM